MSKTLVSMTLNGRKVEEAVEPRTLLVHMIRESLHLRLGVRAATLLKEVLKSFSFACKHSFHPEEWLKQTVSNLLVNTQLVQQKSYDDSEQRSRAPDGFGESFTYRPNLSLRSHALAVFTPVGGSSRVLQDTPKELHRRYSARRAGVT